MKDGDMENENRNQSRTPQVPFRERLYNAEARRLEARGLSPKEYERRKIALARKFGL